MNSGQDCGQDCDGGRALSKVERLWELIKREQLPISISIRLCHCRATVAPVPSPSVLFLLLLSLLLPRLLFHRLHPPTFTSPPIVA